MRGFLRFLRGNTIALLALFIALGGTTYAATALPKNSVGTKQLKKNAVTALKIKNGNVSGPKLKNSAVTNAKIAANAVTGTKVADDSLTGADILESSLGTVPSATTATTATNATTAANATKANGRNVGCATGTVQFLGQCFETALRTATTIFSASDTCKAAGGYLGNVMELRSGRAGNPLTLAGGAGEWAGHVDSDSTDGFRGTTIANNGAVAEAVTTTNTPYRCVYPLVGGPGTAAAAASVSVAAATHADGSR
jgi:hypothetical protein